MTFNKTLYIFIFLCSLGSSFALIEPSLDNSFSALVNGSGTQNNLVKWTAGNMIGDSRIIDDGFNIFIDGLTVIDDLVNELVTINNSLEFSVVIGGVNKLTINESVAGFQGDVVNVDNFNGFSRFQEINLNNGSEAGASLIVTNNVGSECIFSIGSDGFEFLGVPLPSAPSIFCNAPLRYSYINTHHVGWAWINSPTQSTRTNISSPFVARMILDEEGSLNVTGNLTGNLIYGEMWLDENNFTTNISVVDVLVNVSGSWNAGANNGFLFSQSNDGNGSLVVGVSGIYKVDYGLSISDGNNQNFRASIGVNGIAQNNCYSWRKLQAVDIGFLGPGCFVSLVVGDELTIVIKNVDALSDVLAHTANLNVFRIGD